MYLLLSPVFFHLLACKNDKENPVDSRSQTDSPADSDTDTDTNTDTDTDTDTDPVMGATVHELIGINGFIDDPLDRLSAFGALREYHNWQWNDQDGPAYPNEQLQFSLWSGYWDFDAYYKTLHDAGTEVFPAIQGSVASLDYVMPPTTADTTLPDSYLAHASFMYQFAARYGATEVPDTMLKLADGQVRVSGLGYLHDFENGNEPDATWLTSDGSFLFSAEVFAAMASADYDGDQGRLGPDIGVKTADPSARVVMAGLAGAGPGDWADNVIQYWEGVQAWSAEHRGGEFPADVLNVHYYCFGPDGYGVPDPRPGISPEDCGLAQTLATVDAWRDANLPDHPLWLTEFGYDTDPGSNLRAPAIGSKSAEVVQADWLIRSVLAVAEAGFDRATLFVSRDWCSTPDCDGHNIQFSTAGVLKEPGDFTPKVSFWYLSTFRHVLGDMHFAGQVATGDVRVDAFTDMSGAGAYVLWLPSSSDATQDYTLALPNAQTATAVHLVSGSSEGQSEALSINAASVQLTVGETPVLVVVDRL